MADLKLIENEIRNRQKRISVLRDRNQKIVDEMGEHQRWIGENCPHPHHAQRDHADLADMIWRECSWCQYIECVGHVNIEERWVYDDGMEPF